MEWGRWSMVRKRAGDRGNAFSSGKPVSALESSPSRCFAPKNAQGLIRQDRGTMAVASYREITACENESRSPLDWNNIRRSKALERI